MRHLAKPVTFAVVAVSCLLSAAGCAADASDATDGPEESTGSVASPKIIGTNDLVSVTGDGANIPEKYRPLVDAFGRISNGCTATHIGGGLAITAGHCFRAPSTRRDNFPCPSYSVAWGFRKDRAAYMTSPCEIVLAAEQNRNRDYAIFKVSGPAPAAQVEVDYAARPEVNTSLTIFSHPRSRPLEWSQLCTVQPGSTGGWGKDMLSHQCDTEPGSSGATVLADASLKVVAIHDGGRVPWNYATYLSATPIGEFLGAPAAPAEPQAPAADEAPGAVASAAE